MFLAGTLATLSACLRGPALLKQSGSLGSSQATLMATTEEDGAVTGTFDPASGSQILIASDGSGIAGTSVLFPSGALSFPAAFTLEPGASIATPSIASTIGLNGFSGSGSAVVLSSSTSINTDTPMTLSIPLPSVSALQLVMSLFEDVYTSMVVVYRVKDAETGKFETGIIPRAEIQIVDGKAQFSSRRLGAFQTAIVAPEEAVAAKKVEHTEAVNIFTARDVKKIPPIELTAVSPSVGSKVRKEGLLTVTGAYFKADLLAVQITSEGTSFDAKPVAVSNDGTTASFKMPAGVPHGKPVTVVLKQADVSRNTPGPTHDTSGPVISASTISSGPNPDADGKYYVNNTSLHTYTVTTPLADIAAGATAATSMFAFTGQSTATISYPVIDSAGTALTFTIREFNGDGVLTVKLKSGALTDDVGNPSPETTLVSFVVDNTAPTATLSGTPPNPSNITTLDITVGGDGVKTYKYKFGLNSTLSVCSGSADYHASERPITDKIIDSIPATDGSYRLCVIGTDKAGNNQSLSTATIHIWTKDTTRPAAPLIDKIASSSDNPVETNNVKPAFEGTKPAGEPVKISVYRMTDSRILVGSVNVNNSDTTWSFTPAAAIPLGFHSVFATATDAAGNESDAGSAKSLTIDQTAPSAPTVNTIDGKTTFPVLSNNKRPVIAGTFIATETDAKKIRVFHRGTGSGSTDSLIAEIDKPASGSDWSLTPTADIPDGEYSITAKVVDKAGNEGPASPPKNLTIDTTPPVATISNAPSGVSSAAQLDVTITGVAQYRYIIGIDMDSNFCSSTATNDYSAPRLTNQLITDRLNYDNKTYTLCVIGIDAAGNQQTRESATQANWVKGSGSLTTARPSQRSLLKPYGSNSVVVASYLQAAGGVAKIKFKYGAEGQVPSNESSGTIDASENSQWSVATHTNKIYLAMTKGTTGNYDWVYVRQSNTTTDPSNLQFSTHVIDEPVSSSQYILPTLAIDNSATLVCSAAVLRPETAPDELRYSCTDPSTATPSFQANPLKLLTLPSTEERFTDVRIVPGSDARTFHVHASTTAGNLFSWNTSGNRSVFPVGNFPSNPPSVTYPASTSECTPRGIVEVAGVLYVGGNFPGSGAGGGSGNGGPCLYSSVANANSLGWIMLSGTNPSAELTSIVATESGEIFAAFGTFVYKRGSDSTWTPWGTLNATSALQIYSLAAYGTKLIALTMDGQLAQTDTANTLKTWSNLITDTTKLNANVTKIAVTSAGTIFGMSPEGILRFDGTQRKWVAFIPMGTGGQFLGMEVAGSYIYAWKDMSLNNYRLYRYAINYPAVTPGAETEVFSLANVLSGTGLSPMLISPTSIGLIVYGGVATHGNRLGSPSVEGGLSTGSGAAMLTGKSGFGFNTTMDGKKHLFIFNAETANLSDKTPVFRSFDAETLSWGTSVNLRGLSAAEGLTGLPAIHTRAPTDNNKEMIFGLWIERQNIGGEDTNDAVKYRSWPWDSDPPPSTEVPPTLHSLANGQMFQGDEPSIASESFLRLMGVVGTTLEFLP
jgi:hypothetical protein